MSPWKTASSGTALSSRIGAAAGVFAILAAGLLTRLDRERRKTLSSLSRTCLRGRKPRLSPQRQRRMRGYPSVPEAE